jgi:uracil-DNA glycosylase
MGAAPPAPPGFPPEIPSPRTLAELHAVMVRCTRCDLFMSRSQVVPGNGAPRAELLLVGEAPGETEDRKGIPFVGRSGALLEGMLAAGGFAREEVFIANVVRCRPPGNRNPRAAEMRACAGWLGEQVRLIQPTLVVTLGRYALQHFLPGGKITLLQGEVVPVEYGGGPLHLYPLLHPSAILRNPDLRPAYAAQFERIASLLPKLKG